MKGTFCEVFCLVPHSKQTWRTYFLKSDQKLKFSTVPLCHLEVNRWMRFMANLNFLRFQSSLSQENLDLHFQHYSLQDILVSEST